MFDFERWWAQKRAPSENERYAVACLSKADAMHLVQSALEEAANRIGRKAATAATNKRADILREAENIVRGTIPVERDA